MDIEIRFTCLQYYYLCTTSKIWDAADSAITIIKGQDSEMWLKASEKVDPELRAVQSIMSNVIITSMTCLLTCCLERHCRLSRRFRSRGVWWDCSGWGWPRVTWALDSLVFQEQQEEQLLVGCCCCYGNQLSRRQWGDRCSLGWRKGWWESTVGNGQLAQAWLLVTKQNWSIDWSIHPEKTKASCLYCPEGKVLHCEVCLRRKIIHFIVTGILRVHHSPTDI